MEEPKAPEAMKLVDQAAVFDNSGMKPERMLLVERGQIVWRTAEAPPWVLEIATALGLELPVGHERRTHVE